ncbi:hypothetical protein SO694_0001829 [Aureococcus anophagefferens]|uniref:Sulfotransferase domain-containing protein n=1 Tax=Aureococcus anophagefferens TaxID=44056 RepID=A0ABR1G0S7_AURAN
MRLATRVAMIMAAALAISGVASTQAVGPAISGVATTNTSWWRLALAAPAISPDFALLSKHVCKREPIYMYERFWPYFPTDCVRKVDRPDSGLDGLGHVGHRIVGLIADRHGPGPAPHYFQEYVGEGAAYLRDVDGLGDGFAPSLYCHERDWLHAHGNPSQDEIAARWPAGDALFRGHFECFLTPPLDEWFGFDAFPPATDAARKRRAAAEAYAAVDRDALVDCGAADGELRVVVHVRLGDLLHPNLSVNASAEVSLLEMRVAGARLRNALRVVAALRARLPARRVRALILSDSPPETVAATLEGLDVRIHVGGARRDDASRLVDGRTAGLENDFDVSFHGAGHPLVALHCMATADLLLGPEHCGTPWAPRRILAMGADHAEKNPGRCSNMVQFACALSARGACRGLPATPLDATAVDAGIDTFLGSGAQAQVSCPNKKTKCDREADCVWKAPCYEKKCCQPLARPERPSGLGPRYDTRPANVSETSIIFIKIPKCSSSTAGGVARRVASRHGHVGFASQHNGGYRKGTTTSPAVYANHESLVKWIHEFQHGGTAGTWRAFLWTVVREPLARSVSQFFHFEVTRDEKDRSDEKVIARVRRYLKSEKNVLWWNVRTDGASEPRPGDVDELLDAYDLVGTTELFDETMVLLATRLGVPLGDVLSIARRPREWAEKTGFEARVAADYALWRNASARARARRPAAGTRARRVPPGSSGAVADPCARRTSELRKDQCL